MDNSTIGNTFYQEWECAAIIVPIAIALLGCFWFVFKRDDSETKQALYKIKDQIATMFMRTVVSEARCLIKIIENHLPEALTRASRGAQGATRFDKFCAAIREMSAEEFEEAGGKYGFIVRDTFSQILEQEVERLLDAADVNPQSVNARLKNPSGLRFSLEGETVLKLHFLAHRTVRAERRDRQYKVSHKLAFIGFIIGGVGGLSFLVPVFWIEEKWGYIWGQVAFGILACAGIVGLLSTLALGLCERQLKTESQECEDDPGFQKAFEVWKGRGK